MFHARTTETKQAANAARTTASRVQFEAYPRMHSPDPTAKRRQQTADWQRAWGNQAVLKMLQRKLTIGSVSDPLEAEADAAAERVTNSPGRPTIIQRKCACEDSGAPCEQCQKNALQRKAASRGTATEAPPIVDAALSRAGHPLHTDVRALAQKLAEGGNKYHEKEADQVAHRVMSVSSTLGRRAAAGGGGAKGELAGGPMERAAIPGLSSGSEAAPIAPSLVEDVLATPGQPLAETARKTLEPAFGQDFSHVRVHDGPKAAESAAAVNARAYTVGNHIVFGAGQYAPGSAAGRYLLAHELTHTIQQARAHDIAPAAPHLLAPRVSSGPLALARATVTVGGISAQIDYGDLIDIPASGYVTEIQTRFQAYTGTSLDPAVVSQIAAFTARQQEWLLFALDILSENTAQAPGLDRKKAFQRLLNVAPSSTTRGLGTASFAFEREVLLRSGWAEEAVSGGLAAPTAADLAVIGPLLNPPAAPTPGGVFDAVTFKAELPGLTRDVLKQSSANPAIWTAARAQPLSDVRSIADVIQAQALSFFSPFAETARDNRWITNWQYSSNIWSVTTDPAGNPRQFSQSDRLSLIQNRATVAGEDRTKGPSLFSRTNFDPGRAADKAARDAVVAALEADPDGRSLADNLLRHTGVFSPQTLQVGIATEVPTDIPLCDQRWNTVRTLCHELMHSLMHPDFLAAATSSPRFPSGIKFDQLLVEGFAEVLGVQLFSHLRKTAATEATLRGQLSQGLTVDCVPSLSAIAIPTYGAAGPDAEKIRFQVGDPRFRAAFFHGRVSLVGL